MRTDRSTLWITTAPSPKEALDDPTTEAHSPIIVRHSRMMFGVSARSRHSERGDNGREHQAAEAGGRGAGNGAARVHRCRLGAGDAHRQRRRAVHDGRPGRDLTRLRHHRRGDRVRARSRVGQPHQPGGHARPWPSPASSRGKRCPATSPPRWPERRSARSPSSGCSARRRTRSASASRRSTRGWASATCRASVAEFVGTFILVFVIFGVIHRKAPVGWAGLAIGLVVFAAIIPVAPATAAAINPARVVGPMLVLQSFGGAVHWAQLPVYVSAELAAGVAAAARLHAARSYRRRPSGRRRHDRVLCPGLAASAESAV